MSFENTLRQLLADAAPQLRNTVKDTLVAAVLDDQRSVLFEVLRKAYELGYREALANQAPQPPHGSLGAKADDDDDLEPDDADDGVPSVPPDPDDVEDDDGEAGDRAPEKNGGDVDWDALGGSEHAAREGSPSVVRREAAPLRVRSSLTIGSLRSRIFKTFHLERFDIDVVICRKGDKSRRQLKSSVRLAKYELEDEGRRPW